MSRACFFARSDEGAWFEVRFERVEERVWFALPAPSAAGDDKAGTRPQAMRLPSNRNPIAFITASMVSSVGLPFSPSDL